MKLYFVYSPLSSHGFGYSVPVQILSLLVLYLDLLALLGALHELKYEHHTTLFYLSLFLKHLIINPSQYVIFIAHFCL
jgi:hypothetical protein